MNDTKHAIQSAFLKLYLKRSFDRITVKDICALAPAARTTFYEHYGNTAALKAEIEDELIAGILDIAEKTACNQAKKENIADFFTETLDYINKHRDENYAFLVAQPNGDYISKWKNAIKNHFKLCFPEKCGIPNHDLILEVVASGVIGAYTYIMAQPNDVDIKKLSDISVQMLFSALQII